MWNGWRYYTLFWVLSLLSFLMYFSFHLYLQHQDLNHPLRNGLAMNHKYKYYWFMWIVKKWRMLWTTMTAGSSKSNVEEDFDSLHACTALGSVTKASLSCSSSIFIALLVKPQRCILLLDSQFKALHAFVPLNILIQEWWKNLTQKNPSITK